MALEPTLLTVQVAAKRLGVTPRTLKYYEERGLVLPSRSEGRFRLYDENDLEKFERILRLRAVGFSLHAIREMLKRPLDVPINGGPKRLSMASLQEIRGALQGQIAVLDSRAKAVQQELKEVRTVRRELQHDLDYVQARLEGENAEELLARRRKSTAASQLPTPGTSASKRRGGIFDNVSAEAAQRRKT